MALDHVIERRDSDELFGALRSRGYTIVGPTVRDRAIVYDEILDDGRHYFTVQIGSDRGAAVLRDPYRRSGRDDRARPRPRGPAGAGDRLRNRGTALRPRLNRHRRARAIIPTLVERVLDEARSLRAMAQ